MKNYQILRNLRKKEGLTMKEVAEKINVTEAVIGFYEKGRNEPSIDTLVALAKLYHVSIQYLILGEEEKGITITEEEYNVLVVCKKIIDDITARHEAVKSYSTENIVVGNSNAGDIIINSSIDKIKK